MDLKIRPGCVVSVMTKDGVYRGTVHGVHSSGNKLSITNVKEEPSQIDVFGVVHFYRGEIKALKILESPKPETLEPQVKKKDQNGTQEANHAQGINFSGSEEAVNPSEGEIIKACDYPWLANYTYINSVGREYESAIKHINDMRYIGVSLNGDRVGRFGTLSLINIGTVDHVFVFDIYEMGAEAMEKGLAEILEHPRIIKIFHNCRMPSDCLYHCYGVSLNNIFDTQVADALIYQEHHNGDLPKTVKSLFDCVQEYLDLYPHQLPMPSLWDSGTTREEKMWLSRPLPTPYVEAAVNEVCYLRDLQKVCIKLMLSRFTAGVNAYLSHVRDEEDEGAVTRQARLHLMPEQFKDLKAESTQSLRK